jgi:ATP synthase protein I
MHLGNFVGKNMEINPKSDNERKLEELSRKVAIVRESRQQAEMPIERAPNSVMAIGMRMASEFVSAIIVGAVLGYGIDYWLKSKPIGLMIGLGIGFAAGIVNLVRAARAMTPNVSDAVAVPDEDEE